MTLIAAYACKTATTVFSCPRYLRAVALSVCFILAYGSSASAQLWAPSNIATVAWFDASDLTTISTNAGGAVSEWRDKGSNSFHLSQGNASAQPLSGVTNINGLNVITADGVDDWLRSVSITGYDSNVATFVVAEIANPVSDRADMLWEYRNTGFYGFRANGGGSSGNFDGIIDPVGGSDLPLIGGPFFGPSIYNVNFDWSGGQIFNAYIDGIKRSTNGNYTARPLGGFKLQLWINSPAVPERYLDASIAEIIILDDMSQETREIIEGYLAHKWGIQDQLPSNHRYKISPPYVQYEGTVIRLE